MRKEIRRFLMLCTIVTVGLILLFLDVTLIQLLLIIMAVVIIIPFLLGMVTVAEVRTGFEEFKEKRLKKITILRKLDDIKLFEKKSARKEIPVPKAPAKTEAPKPAQPGTAGGSARKLPFSDQISSLVSSLKSFGTVLRERTKRERKVGDINQMLDKTVSEKVAKSAAPPAGAPPADAGLPAPAGGGGGSAAETDPFLSLSGDEFDAGLLDGLDEGELAMPAGEGAADTPLPEPELSMPSMDLDSAAGDILKQNAAEGLEEFSSLDAPGGEEEDFGDLDSLSLDDVDLDVDLDDESEGAGSPAAAPEAPSPAPATAPAAPAEPSGAVKTTWIPSDAPKGADMGEDQIGTQADMAAFASSSGGSDEDLLSSIASDVKRTVKEKDVSLLRELKDFKAPADQIERELADMYQKMSVIQSPKPKDDTPTNGIK